jgi:hypothetical protein
MIFLFISDLNYLEMRITFMPKQSEEHTRYITNILEKEMENASEC